MDWKSSEMFWLFELALFRIFKSILGLKDGFSVQAIVVYRSAHGGRLTMEKRVFSPREMSNTCKNYKNLKIPEKWLSFGTPLFHQIVFSKMIQNGL